MEIIIQWHYGNSKFKKNLHKSENANENWNFNEFIHAAIILVTFHKLAAISESLDLSVRSQNDLCQNLNSSDKSK